MRMAIIDLRVVIFQILPASSFNTTPNLNGRLGKAAVKKIGSMNMSYSQLEVH